MLRATLGAAIRGALPLLCFLPLVLYGEHERQAPLEVPVECIDELAAPAVPLVLELCSVTASNSVFLVQTDQCGATARTVADGTIDYGGTSGERATNTGTSPAETCALTSAAKVEPFEGTGTVSLDVVGTGSTTWHWPSGSNMASIHKVKLGFSVTITLDPVTGADVVQTFTSASLKTFPETWTIDVDQHDGDLAGGSIDLEMSWSNMGGIENLAASCSPTWGTSDADLELVVNL